MATPIVTRLLDVNVLVALVDPAHVQHGPAHEWFGRIGQLSFATCPLTENGLLRIVGNSRYPNSPGTPAAVVATLAALRALPGHVFWGDDISLLDERYVDPARLLGHAQVTDTYLLALALAHGARLASLDRRLVTSAVRGGAAALELI
jgi:toxin-antitoxin system PIN domain toxin